jgi:transcriptional regulator with XRE-family HTH domain
MTTLQLIRQQRGLSKTEAARLARMLLVDYSLAERGLLTPSAGQTDRLERAFDYPLAQLLAPVTCPPLGGGSAASDPPA